MKKVNIYIYTTVKSPRKKQGAYTYVLEVETNKENATRSDTKVLEHITAHQAELTALVAAIKRIYKHCDLTIYMDSVHVAECTEKWMKKWRDAGWKNAKGQQVANIEKWRELACLLDEHSYRFIIGEQHSYYEWMKAEAERAEKDVHHRNNH